MKLLPLLLVCIGALATAQAAAPDPFGGASPSWTATLEAAKPLRLEICFGETGDPAVNSVTPEFLAAAKTLRIAVAPYDQGRVETSDALTATYRLIANDQAYFLDLSVGLATDGRREINTSVTLTPNQWVVLGGLTRTQVGTTKRKAAETRKNLIAAVRLVPAKP